MPLFLKIIKTQAIMYLSYCVFHVGSFTILKGMTAYKNINMYYLTGKKRYTCVRGAYGT